MVVLGKELNVGLRNRLTVSIFRVGDWWYFQGYSKNRSRVK